MVEPANGFLGRWARRKTDALQGKPLDEPAAPVKPVAAATPVATAAPLPAADAGEAAQPEKIPLSLEDVRQLGKDADFSPFMARDVGPEVRNAAMKKLFTDPHFNVMDGLDIYIDDYSIADPIPESMLRQMAGAEFLKLFDHEKKDEETTTRDGNPAASPRETAHTPGLASVAQSPDAPDLAGLPPPMPENSSQPESIADSGASQQDHANTHLRLQPDHAPTAPDAGRGTQ
ncbi:DUF3306 domain-containing protein [Polaromonas sp.]|uniref:DUF3306 domain-containing protein n=1 Tax=Polaromonas sp. TaxID=1869339 RepID=UPI001DC82034|nr:DUF3306 domain-containing protein [Polaromonas sp.]MBT9476180.1 DUF3306 domain-containing protein [Polaromonas sp.]